jgi:hypothetical protein
MLSMEQHLQPLIKHFKIFALLFFVSTSSIAQIKMNYSMGGIQFEQSGKISFSGPILVDSKQCISVFNGVEQFTLFKSGTFVSGCSIKSDVGLKMKINSYPNPFSNYLNIYSDTYNPSLMDDKILIELTSSDGIKVISKYFNFSEVKAGIKLFTAPLLPGSYMLGIKSNQIKTEFIKLIKL